MKRWIHPAPTLVGRVWSVVWCLHEGRLYLANVSNLESGHS